jgi:hypothetical protein
VTDETKRQLHYLIDRAANKERTLDQRCVAITQAIGLLYDELCRLLGAYRRSVRR